VSRVTGFSPYQLLHATDPLLPLDLVEATFLVENLHAGMTTQELLVWRMRQLNKHPADVARAAKVLKKARFTSKEQFEKRFIRRLTRQEYQKGELVLLRNSAIEESLDRKTKDRFLGPYEVYEKSSNSSYVLRELDGTKLRHRISANHLLPYITRDHPFMTNHYLENDPDSGSEAESESQGTQDSNSEGSNSSDQSD